MADTDNTLTLGQRSYLWLQHALPHHALSMIVNAATRSTFKPFKNLLIRQIQRRFDVDMSAYEHASPDAYESFNAFFTRPILPEHRPIDADELSIVSPVDGAVSQAGTINDDRVFQAKGIDYSLEALVGDTAEAQAFRSGEFATLYLSPRDYHRIHMPCDGTLRRTIYIPGRLFSVAPLTTNHIPGLFARNERLVCLFDTPAGRMALIMVGAVMVSAMDTVWSGPVPPAWKRRINDYPEEPPTLTKGQEMGRFNMGSTVILLFEEDAMQWLPKVEATARVKMGESIGTVRRSGVG